MNGILLAASEDAVVDVSANIYGGSVDFLELVKDIGNTCIQNEICMMFLTATFVGLGVRMLRKVIGAFGRGR